MPEKLIEAKENKSQFHYGSIKTFTFDELKSLLGKSQFHYGSIKTFAEFLYDYLKEQGSQFHYGSIKTGQRLGNFNEIIKVSIPLWFD